MCEISPTTIDIYERTGQVQHPKSLRPSADRYSILRAALEAAGIEFIEENGGGPGVRLRPRVAENEATSKTDTG